MNTEISWDEKWEKRFEGKDTFLTSSLDQCSQRCFKIIKQWCPADPVSMLEAGSGTGRFCIALAEAYSNSRIIALDLSDSALKLTKGSVEKKGLKNIACVKGDIRSMPFDNDSFDIVFNEGVIEHFADPEAIVREMCKVVKPEGKVIVAVPNRFNLIYNLTLFFSRNESIKYGYTKLFKHRELKDLFRRCGLTDIEISGFDPAHAVTRLSEYWPKCEWLGRKIDSFLIRPLDLITNKAFSSRFGFETIICGTKMDKKGLDEKISIAWSQRGKSKYHYANFQLLAAGKETILYRRFVNFQGKKILDIGCGLGGKTVRYTKEADTAFAIDCKFDNLVFAKEFSVSKKVPIKFAQADISTLPFKGKFFDVIILNDIIEHLSRPKEALLECGRILKDNGIIFLNFPPFYGPNGGHLGYYFPIPWIHLLPMRLIRYLLLRKRPKEGWLTPEIVLDVFNSTNGLTVKQFRKLVNYTQLKIRYSEVEPYDFRLLKKFKGLPFFDELISKNAHFVLEKR